MNNESLVKEVLVARGIPYDEIDMEMRDLIYLLNVRLGLKTQFCCVGHEEDQFDQAPYIIFDSEVTDEQIIEISTRCAEHIWPFSFKKWVRPTCMGEIDGSHLYVNWMLEFDLYWASVDMEEKVRGLGITFEILCPREEEEREVEHIFD